MHSAIVLWDWLWYGQLLASIPLIIWEPSYIKQIWSEKKYQTWRFSVISEYYLADYIFFLNTKNLL